MTEGYQWLWPTATIVATFLGPIFAVLATRFVDRIRAQEQRRWELFRQLMAARGDFVSPEYVSALNLVPIEFNGHASVVGAWKDVLDHVSNDNSGENWVIIYREKQVILLYKMAVALKAKLDQLYILNGLYMPKALNQRAQMKAEAEEGLWRILTHKDALPVMAINLPTETSHQQDSEESG